MIQSWRLIAAYRRGLEKAKGRLKIEVTDEEITKILQERNLFTEQKAEEAGEQAK